MRRRKPRTRKRSSRSKNSVSAPAPSKSASSVRESTSYFANYVQAEAMMRKRGSSLKILAKQSTRSVTGKWCNFRPQANPRPASENRNLNSLRALGSTSPMRKQGVGLHALAKRITRNNTSLRRQRSLAKMSSWAAQRNTVNHQRVKTTSFGSPSRIHTGCAVSTRCRPSRQTATECMESD